MNDKVIIELFEKIILLCETAKGYLTAYSDVTDQYPKGKTDSSFDVKVTEEEPMTHILKNRTIRTRADGRFEIRARIDGKTVTTGISHFKEKAIKMHNEKIRALQPIALPSKKLTLHNWLHQWLEQKKKSISIASYKQYLITIESHIKPNIKDMELTKLIPIHVQNMLHGIEKDRARTDAFTRINDALKTAYQNRYIKENVCNFVKRPTYETINRTALTISQQKEFLSAVDQVSKFKELYAFYILTGCRPAEAFYVKWEHVEDKRLFIPGTKNKYSKRFVPINDELQKILNKLEKTTLTTPLFLITKKQLREDFEKVRKLLNFEMQIRDLRHTYATRLYEMRIDKRVRAKWMGHAPNSTINETVYTETQKEFENSEISKIKLLLT